MFTTLVNAAQIKSNCEQWRIVDCRFDLRDPGAGRRAYLAGHLPGAVFADLEQDLSGPLTPTSGRHPLPDRAQLAARLGALGIGPETQVIAYDDLNGAFAARLRWLLRWLGHSGVAVLDGGLTQWIAQGHALETGAVSVPPASFSCGSALESCITTENVIARHNHPQFLLLDVRSPERYRGEVEPIDPIAGHVPGAVNYPLQNSLSANGCFHPAQTLRTQFQPLLGSHSCEETAIMCGSGVTACHLLLALAVAGVPGAHLYAGSWSEWIRDPLRPIARGTQR